MQRGRALLLLGVSCSLRAADAGSLPRGVSPEFASYFEGKYEFTCINDASIKLALDRINDNTCDCPDGSDEPGTAACAHIDPLSPQQPLPGSSSGSTNSSNALPGFWCANEGHVGSYVPFMYVNDGVCDYDLCCDGSEEFAGVGGVKCPNRCSEIGKEHRKLEATKRESLAKAEKKRSAMIKEAQELRQHAEARLAELQRDLTTLEEKKAELQKKYEEVERANRGKVVKSEDSGGKVGVLAGLAKARVNELRNTLSEVVQQRNHLRSKVTELEGILTKFKAEYNPNFNDEGVKAAVKTFEDYAARAETEVQGSPSDADVDEVLKEDSAENGVNWQEFEGDDNDTDILYNFEAYLPGFFRNLLHEKMDRLRIWLITNGMLADTRKPGVESHLVRAAREAVEAADSDRQDKQRLLEDQQADLGKDYGPSDIFRALKGKTVSIDAGEYTYELTWLENTSQNSKKGHGNTNMGNFARIDRAFADDEERLDGKSLGRGERMVLRYEDGLGCWNGPSRRTDVWLACAETEELWRVSEAEKCVYKMEVGTAAACGDLTAVDGGTQPGHKDEL